MIDTHCHLNLDSFFPDTDAVIDRAREAGVQKMVVVGIDIESSERALKLAEDNPDIYATAGIHPNDCHKAPRRWEEPILEMLAHPKVVAVGETGLDYYWKDSPHELQKRFFWDHLDLAMATGLPIVIHNRDANEDVRDLVLEHGNSKGVFHCWPAPWDIARPLLEKGYHISFTGTVTFKNNTAVQDVAARMPLERLLLETDSPFLTPVPFRGKKPNEPHYLVHVADHIAELRKIVVEELATQTTINAVDLFGLNND